MTVTTTTREHVPLLLGDWGRFWPVPHPKSDEYAALTKELLDRNLDWLREALDELGTAWHAESKAGRPVPYKLYRAYRTVCDRHNAAGGADRQGTVITSTCPACQNTGMCETLQAGRGVAELQYVRPDATAWPAGTTYVTTSGYLPCTCARGQAVMDRRNQAQPGFYHYVTVRKLQQQGVTLPPGGATKLAEQLGPYGPARAVAAGGANPARPPEPWHGPPADLAKPYPNASQAQPFTPVGQVALAAATAVLTGAAVADDRAPFAAAGELEEAGMTGNEPDWASLALDDEETHPVGDHQAFGE